MIKVTQKIKLKRRTIAILYFKSHDDFLYYHLSFINNLTLNKVEFGLGNFDLAFNHVSSLFFFHSLFSFPFTGDYFYFIGPALIMVFFIMILYLGNLHVWINNLPYGRNYFNNYQHSFRLFLQITLIYVTYIIYKYGN